MTKPLTLKARAIRDNRALTPRQKLALHLKEHPELIQIGYGTQNVALPAEIERVELTRISIDLLLRNILATYNITVEQISKPVPKDRKLPAAVREAQYVFCHLAWNMCLESQRAIGKKINREQQHVATTCFQVKKRLEHDADFRKKVEEIRKSLLKSAP